MPKLTYVQLDFTISQSLYIRLHIEYTAVEREYFNLISISIIGRNKSELYPSDADLNCRALQTLTQGIDFKEKQVLCIPFFCCTINDPDGNLIWHNVNEWFDDHGPIKAVCWSNFCGIKAYNSKTPKDIVTMNRPQKVARTYLAI